MIAWITMGLLVALTTVAAVCDIRTHKIPKWLTLPGLLIGLVWSSIAGAMDPAVGSWWLGLQNSFLAMSCGLIGFGIIFAAGGLGGGDVKLMGAVGAVTASWQCVLATAFYAFIFGAVIALIVMVYKGLSKRTMSRLFGVALLAAARVKPDIPEDSPRIPYALAVCLGGLLGCSEFLLGLPTPWNPW